MNKTRKRLLSAFLVMSMVFTCLIGMSATALADSTAKKIETGVKYEDGDIIDFGTDTYVVWDYYQNPPNVTTFTGQWKLSYDGIDYDVGDFRFRLTSVDDPSDYCSIYCPAPNGIAVAPDGFVFVDGDGTQDKPYTPGGVYPFSVTYDANGADSGTVPVDADKHDLGTNVTVLDNTGNLVKDGKSFGGWNTEADGSGTTYTAGQTFSISKDTVLYALWVEKATEATTTATEATEATTTTTTEATTTTTTEETTTTEATTTTAAPIVYNFTEGADGTWSGDGNGLTVRAVRANDEANTLPHFKGIKVDGNDVAAENYTASNGSVIVTLKADYLKTLPAGEHTLTLVFDDSDPISTKFTIKAADTVVATGESTSPTAAIGALLIAAAIGTGVFVVRKRKETNI